MRILAAEFLGTFFLVFCGTGAIIIDSITGGGVSHVGICITFGLIVFAMIMTFGDVSGAHLNPAVTIGFWISKSFPGRRVPGMIAAQCIGAIAASVLLRVMFPSASTLGETVPRGDVLPSFVLEVIMTALLMLVIINVATNSKESGLSAALTIGAVVALEALFGGPISGASMNPARSLGPAVVSGNVGALWIYIVGPISGASLVSFFGSRADEKRIV